MKINSNMASGNAQKNLNRVDGQKKSTQQSASGKNVESVKGGAVAKGVASKIDAAVTQVVECRAGFNEAHNPIEDSDTAKAIAERTRSLILENGGAAGLAHGNAASQLAMGLLGKEV